MPSLVVAVVGAVGLLLARSGVQAAPPSVPAALEVTSISAFEKEVMARVGECFDYTKPQKSGHVLPCGSKIFIEAACSGALHPNKQEPRELGEEQACLCGEGSSFWIDSVACSACVTGHGMWSSKEHKYWTGFYETLQEDYCGAKAPLEKSFEAHYDRQRQRMDGRPGRDDDDFTPGSRPGHGVVDIAEYYKSGAPARQGPRNFSFPDRLRYSNFVLKSDGLLAVPVTMVGEQPKVLHLHTTSMMSPASVLAKTKYTQNSPLPIGFHLSCVPKSPSNKGYTLLECWADFRFQHPRDAGPPPRAQPALSAGRGSGRGEWVPPIRGDGEWSLAGASPPNNVGPSGGGRTNRLHVNFQAKASVRGPFIKPPRGSGRRIGVPGGVPGGAAAHLPHAKPVSPMPAPVDTQKATGNNGTPGKRPDKDYCPPRPPLPTTGVTPEAQDAAPGSDGSTAAKPAGDANQPGAPEVPDQPHEDMDKKKHEADDDEDEKKKGSEHLDDDKEGDKEMSDEEKKEDPSGSLWRPGTAEGGKKPDESHPLRGDGDGDGDDEDDEDDDYLEAEDEEEPKPGSGPPLDAKIEGEKAPADDPAKHDAKHESNKGAAPETHPGGSTDHAAPTAPDEPVRGDTPKEETDRETPAGSSDSEATVTDAPGDPCKRPDSILAKCQLEEDARNCLCTTHDDYFRLQAHCRAGNVELGHLQCSHNMYWLLYYMDLHHSYCLGNFSTVDAAETDSVFSGRWHRLFREVDVFPS